MKRLRLAEDGKPRLFFLKGSSLARDPKLLAAREPTSTEEEFELYLWQEGIKDSTPVKRHDHGMDALRYLCLFLDSPPVAVARAFPEFSTRTHVKDGVTYQGGELIVGLGVGVGTSALSVHEVRMLGKGELEIATLAALEFEGATADVLATAIRPFLDRYKGLRVFAESTGGTWTPTTGVLGELTRLGLRVLCPDRLRDVPDRVHTVRLLLGGKQVRGMAVRYVCGNEGRALTWFAECLEEASWPTDREGEVSRAPIGLTPNRYSHHADAFCCAVEGYFVCRSATVTATVIG
jgi:hypothetical protein